jgi:hypothetical protein
MGGVVLETESERIIRIERTRIVRNMLENGFKVEDIARVCGYDLNFVQQVKNGDIPKL